MMKFKIDENDEIVVIMSKQDAELLINDLENTLDSHDGNVSHEYFEFKDGIDIMKEKIK